MLTRLTTLGLTYMPIPEQGPYQKLVKGCHFPFLERDDSLSTFSANPDKGRSHVIIQSDNLAAMMAYNAVFNTVTSNGSNGAQNVDVIYIDPPYNTGAKAGQGVFRYNDSIVSAEDKNYHSAWLNFMEKRLVEFRRSLTETGVIIVAVGDDEESHLRLLLDAVFGRKNFISRVNWGGRIKNDSRFVSNTSDYMFIYAKSREALVNANVKWRTIRPAASELLALAHEVWSSEAVQSFSGTPHERAAFAGVLLSAARKSQFDKDHEVNGGGLAGYKHFDVDGELYQAGPLDAPSGVGNPSRYYEVLHPATGQPCAIPSRGWPTRDTLQKWIDEGQVVFGVDHTTVPRRRLLLRTQEVIVMRDEFSWERDIATKELAALIGRGSDGKPVFNNPKDRTILAQWIDYVTPQFRKDEALAGGAPIRILDGFAGSGTTLHAVMDLNKADGVPRDCILITNNEDMGVDDQNSKTGVARDVTAPRIRAAITGEWEKGGAEGYDDSMFFYRLLFTDGEDTGALAEISRTGDEMLDDMENILQFEAYFDGLASLETGAHVPVEIEVEGIEQDHYSVFTDTVRSRAVIVWKSSEWAMDDPEVLERMAAAVQDAIPTATTRHIYAPGRKASEFDVPDGWEARAFPLDYIRNLVHTVEKYEEEYAAMADFFGMNDDTLGGAEEEN